MAQKNRANMLTDIVSNIYNNLINFITGQNAQDRFVNLLDSSPNILSDASQANGYVSTDANNEILSVYYNQNDNRTTIISMQAIGLLYPHKFYQINDADSNTRLLQVCAQDAFVLQSFAIDMTTGEIGTYDITTDVFTPIVGSGNASITPILAAALATLESTTSLSLTTIYIVTDAPLPIYIVADDTGQLAKTGSIVSANYSGVVHYDLATNTFLNGTIYDGDGNTWNGCLPSDTTLGAGCVRNTFGQSISGVVLGTNAIDNNFGSKTSGFVFGNSLQYVTVEAGLSGADYSTLPAYSFLYSNAYPATIFRIGGINYHRYYDVANDRIVITDLATPANVTYIGGGGGDVVGPASAVSNNITLFDGTTGKLIKDGGVALSALVPYTGATADVDLDNNGLDAKFVKIKGTAGNGHLNLKHQSSGATAGGSESVLYADNSGNPAWKNDGNALQSILTNSNITQVITNGVTDKAPSEDAVFDALALKTNTQTLTCIGLVIVTVNDATNYHIGTIAATPAGIDARRAFKPTANCTVTAASLSLEQVINGSNETVSIYLRNVTDATETLIGTFTSDFGASTTLKTLFSGLSISLVTTKDYTIRFTTPTWATNPSQWIPAVTLQMTL
jgi:hypothetical protein